MYTGGRQNGKLMILRTKNMEIIIIICILVHKRTRDASKDDNDCHPTFLLQTLVNKSIPVESNNKDNNTTTCAPYYNCKCDKTATKH